MLSWFFQASVGAISKVEYLDGGTYWHGKLGWVSWKYSYGPWSQSRVALRPCRIKLAWCLRPCMKIRGILCERKRVWGGANRQKVLKLVSLVSVVVWKVTIICRGSGRSAAKLRCHCLRTGIINGSFPLSVKTTPAVIYLVQCVCPCCLCYWVPLGFL